MLESVAVHPAPVWRERADFIITADIAQKGLEREWEQLWAKRLSDSQFAVCCVPFFVYDLALGDLVEVGPKRDKDYVVLRVVQPSGRYTFRVWFGDSAGDDVRRSVESELRALGALLEWHSNNLLALDAADSQVAHVIADYLFEHEKRGDLRYETGRTG